MGMKFGNRVLRRIFGCKGRKWQEAGEDCIMRGFVICTSLSIIREVKLRMMRLAGNVACTGENRNAYIILVKNLEGRDHAEDLGVDGRIILERVLRTYGRKTWTGCIWLRILTSSGVLGRRK
jgi:hypothetical protein